MPPQNNLAAGAAKIKAATNSSDTNSSEADVRGLGDLLVAAGFITSAQLLDLSHKFDPALMPFGRMLISSGAASAHELDVAKKLLLVIENTSLPASIAAQALVYVRAERLSTVAALSKACVDGQVISYSRIGVLLIDANIVSKEQMDEARHTAKHTRMPLGRILCLMGLINANFLTEILEIQNKLRLRALNKDEAIELLQNSPNRLINKLADKLAGRTENRLKRELQEPITLSYILLKAKICTEAQVKAALVEPLDLQELTEGLIHNAGADSDIISTAIGLQTAVNLGLITLESAVDVLSYLGRQSGAANRPG